MSMRLLVMLALSLLAACAKLSKPADALYLNARVYTANPEAPWAESLVVRGDELVYVGDAAGAASYSSAVTHDLAGRLVLPGLIDGHVHPGFIAMFAGLLALPEAPDRESQMRDIAQLIADNRDRESVLAIGWYNEYFGPEGPHRRDLDALESERPVIIFDITMHSLWTNSLALELSGIGDDPVDPWPGVAYYQRDESGQLSGYITESAAFKFGTGLIDVGVEQERVLAAFLADLSRNGVTTVFDAGNFGTEDEIYAAVNRLDQRGELPVRYHGTYSIQLPAEYPGAVAELKRIGNAYNSERVRIDTLKVFYDGVVETRGAHLLADYDDRPGHRGASLLSEEQLTSLILDLDHERLHLHVHTIGDQAVRSVLNAVEQAHRELGRAPHSRITLTHLQVVDPADHPRFAELGVIAQFTPAWHGNDGDWYRPALGDRADTAYQVRPLLDAGAVVSFSSDVYFPSEWHDGSANPFTGIQIGHTRQYREDAPDGPRGPDAERLELEVLVDGYTRSAAWQLGQEQRLGSLQAGKQADFIVLHEDLLEIDPSRIHDVQAAAVILGGELVQGMLP